LRRDLRRNRTAGRILHTDLVLEVGGLARRCGWEVSLEPRSSRNAPPADVRLGSPAGPLLVEARVLTERDIVRTQRRRLDEVIEHLTVLTANYRVWLEGQLAEPLDDTDVRTLERWIALESPSARIGHVPTLTMGNTEVRLVRREDASGSLRSGPV